MIPLLPWVPEDSNPGSLEKVFDGQDAPVPHEGVLGEEVVRYEASTLHGQKDQVPFLHSAKTPHHQPSGGHEDSVVPREVVRHLHRQEAQLRDSAKPSFQI